MGLSQRNSGKSFERTVATRMRQIFDDLDVKRGWQTRQGIEEPDVLTPVVSIECKFHKSFSWSDAVTAVDQIHKDATPDTYEVVYVKRKAIKGKPRPGDGRIYAVMAAEEFEEMLDELWELRNL